MCSVSVNDQRAKQRKAYATGMECPRCDRGFNAISVENDGSFYCRGCGHEWTPEDFTNEED